MPSLPETYKVACFESQGAPLTFKQVKLQLPKSGEILAKVLACGVCHSDSAVQQGELGNSFPIVPGHELVGEVVAIPEDEKVWKVGDRVGGPWHGGHDGRCRSCQKGLFQICDNEAVNGVTRDGGYGEYVTLRSEAVVRVPTDMKPAEVAPLLCAGVTVFNGMRKQHIESGGLIAVQGLGGLGHLAIQYVRRAGYRCVAISSSASKKDFALKTLGAHDYIDASKGDVGEQLQKMGGANLVMLTAPSQKLIPSLIDGLAPLGRILVLAMAGPIEITPALWIQKGLGIVAWPSGHQLDCEEAIEFAQHQDVKCMIEEYPLDKANEAMAAMVAGKVRFRGVLIP